MTFLVMGGTSLRKRKHGISDGRVGIPCLGVGRSDLACPGAGNHTTFPVVWVRIATNLKWKTAGLESSLDFGVLGAPPRVPGGLGGPRTHRMKLRTVALHGPGARRARRARRRRAAWGRKECHRRRPEWNPWFSGSSTRILSVLGPDPRHDTPGPGTRKNRHFRRPGRNPWVFGVETSDLERPGAGNPPECFQRFGSDFRRDPHLAPTSPSVSKCLVRIFGKKSPFGLWLAPDLVEQDTGDQTPGEVSDRTSSGHLLPASLRSQHGPSAASVLALSTRSPPQNESTEAVGSDLRNESQFGEKLEM